MTSRNPWQLGAMPFALVRTPVADKNRRAGETAALDLLREGHASVGELPARQDRLVLIVAASDVLLTTAMVRTPLHAGAAQAGASEPWSRMSSPRMRSRAISRWVLASSRGHRPGARAAAC